MTEWVEITVEEGPDGGVTKRVPKAWYEYNQRAKRVRRTLIDRFGERDGVDGIALTKGENRIDGKTVLKPVVYADGAVVADIPDERDGIPIRIDEPKGDLVLD